MCAPCVASSLSDAHQPTSPPSPPAQPVQKPAIPSHRPSYAHMGTLHTSPSASPSLLQHPGTNPPGPDPRNTTQRPPVAHAASPLESTARRFSSCLLAEFPSPSLAPPVGVYLHLTSLVLLSAPTISPCLSPEHRLTVAQDEGSSASLDICFPSKLLSVHRSLCYRVAVLPPPLARPAAPPATKPDDAPPASLRFAPFPQPRIADTARHSLDVSFYTFRPPQLMAMVFIQALRRSIKGDREKQQSVSFVAKSAVAIVPPKKVSRLVSSSPFHMSPLQTWLPCPLRVAGARSASLENEQRSPLRQVIRALYDYEARSAQELSFSRGDFFHVIGREDDADWYEACNPALPDARGLVPVAFFQALGRTERDSGQSDGARPPTASKVPYHDSGYSESHSSQPSGTSLSSASQRNSKLGKTGAMVYGVVMYDFAAERADELEAKAGEAIIVIAQSNPEWFVAKPIGRLGGPGLIPVSFVEIRDMATDKAIPDPGDAIKRAGVPRVEEWKKMAAEYKNSSITLGKFEGGQALEQGMERMSLQQNGRQSSQNGVVSSHLHSRAGRVSPQGADASVARPWQSRVYQLRGQAKFRVVARATAALRSDPSPDTAVLLRRREVLVRD